MKNNFKFLIASILMISLGCTDRGDLDFIQYKMVNNSGHKITLSVESRNFPADIILLESESYEWQNPTSHVSAFFPFSFTGSSEIRVEYDNSCVVLFVPGDGNQRTPISEVNYVKEKIGGNKYLYTYTFTKEDYEYAVNQ